MNIQISDGKFDYKLYDKRRDYNFNVISLPNLKSNVPISAAYSVIYSQILRYFEATNNIVEFYYSLSTLKTKMRKQNFNEHGIVKQINKFFNTMNYEFIAKFWVEPKSGRINYVSL